jgi:hypothetical protein
MRRFWIWSGVGCVVIGILAVIGFISTVLELLDKELEKVGVGGKEGAVTNETVGGIGDWSIRGVPVDPMDCGLDEFSGGI